MNTDLPLKYLSFPLKALDASIPLKIYAIRSPMSHIHSLRLNHDLLPTDICYRTISSSDLFVSGCFRMILSQYYLFNECLCFHVPSASLLSNLSDKRIDVIPPTTFNQ
jgi:hypothetical protein